MTTDDTNTAVRKGGDVRILVDGYTFSPDGRAAYPHGIRIITSNAVPDNEVRLPFDETLLLEMQERYFRLTADPVCPLCDEGSMRCTCTVDGRDE